MPSYVRRLITVSIGAVGGLLVGLTSVGSGSIIIVCLMLLYPTLRGAQLVGTDLVQAIPLVAAAAIAHIIVGDFELGLTASILIGALPAVYVGARMSAIAPDGVIRPALVIVLLASALKLLDVPTQIVGLALVVVALVGFSLWRAVDAASFPEALWALIERDRTEWIRRLLFLAPVGIGFGYAVVYFAKIRPRLAALVAAPWRIVVPTAVAS